MKVWIRNLTKDTDLVIELPIDEDELDDILNPNDEYIITESETLNVGEYDSIDELNKFLLNCKVGGISLEELKVLSKIMFYHEIIEAVNNESYCIVDFDTETADWYCGNGGNITSDFDKGMCLYDSGYYSPFSFEVTEEMRDWIDWESVWVNATTEGWQEISINGHGYLAHR